MSTVKFDISAGDSFYASEIISRFLEIQHGLTTPENYDEKRVRRLPIMMDLVACHANGCPLNFRELSKADDFNLVHDVVGIANHIDRTTGKLDGRFRPRFAK